MERNDTDMRVKATVRIEKTSDGGFKAHRYQPAQGRVYIDVSFDGCRLQSQVVFSGDYDIAQGIYDGRYRLTPESDLLDAETGEKIKWH